MKNDYYDTDRIISAVLSSGVDISPQERFDWVMFGHALKVLGYDESTFVALSSGDERKSRRVWRAERNVRLSEDQARAKIVALAKAAGMDLNPFRLIPGTSTTNDNRRTTPSMKRNPQPEPPKLPPIYIPMEEVRAAEQHGNETTLYNFLCRLFPSEEVSRVFGLYHVGATAEFGKAPGYGCAFPYINAEGNCVDVHLQRYNADGNRTKQGYSQNWSLYKRKQNDRRAPWCVFGEHLTQQRTTAPIGIVESEKTALVATLAAPSFVWIATGSESNLTPSRLAQLKQRRCYVFPDADGLEQWEAKANALREAGFSIYFCGQFITNHAQGETDDVADIIINHLNTLNR